jgi:signal peptidase I
VRRIAPGTRQLARFLLMMIAGLVLMAALPTVFGWHSSVIGAESMSPLLHRGDVVLLVPAPLEKVHAGQVVGIARPSADGDVTIHRLIRIDPASRLITQGDANPKADPGATPPTELVGVARMRLPYLGMVVLWAQEQEYGRLSLLGALTLLLGVLAVGIRPRSTVKPPRPRQRQRQKERQREAQPKLIP